MAFLYLPSQKPRAALCIKWSSVAQAHLTSIVRDALTTRAAGGLKPLADPNVKIPAVPIWERTGGEFSEW
jgi:hypothetical protein